MGGATDDNDTLIGGGESGLDIGSAQGADIGEHQVKIIAFIGIDERIAIAAGDIVGRDSEIRGNARLNVSPPGTPPSVAGILGPFVSDPEAIVDGISGNA